MKEKLGVCKLLPLDAREALVNASKKPQPWRQAAIEDATERVKRKYPKYFRTEKEQSNES